MSQPVHCSRVLNIFDCLFHFRRSFFIISSIGYFYWWIEDNACGLKPFVTCAVDVQRIEGEYMRKKRCKYGIIFDMDNTLLQSRIDFAGMKEAVFIILVKNKLCMPELEWKTYTTSQLIEMARQSSRLTEETEAEVWRAVAEFEKQGMQGATLEPHVPEVLKYLCEDYHLVILTNNAQEAALEALQKTGIAHYFDHIVGREQMEALKPSSSGVHYVLRQYPHIPAEHWLMIGDSWIDGKAAQDGKVRFVAYKGKVEEMEKKQVYPIAHLTDMRDLVDFLVWIEN
jgi:phosphoglycolate phosphatase